MDMKNLKNLKTPENCKPQISERFGIDSNTNDNGRCCKCDCDCDCGNLDIEFNEACLVNATCKSGKVSFLFILLSINSVFNSSFSIKFNKGICIRAF